MNNLTAEKCREQFEEWLKSTGQNPPYATKRGYWEIWKASREALEIALPILEQQELRERQDRGEWIEWGGGEFPAPLCEVVDVRWRAGGTMTVIAGEHVWTHDGTFDDIIAYRIIPERATNQNGDEV